jgi:peroxiredoxin
MIQLGSEAICSLPCPELPEATDIVVLLSSQYMHISKKTSWRVSILDAGVIFLVFFLLTGCSSEDSNRLKIGDQAPDYSITDLRGEKITSAGWNGFPVILRFWDTECKYCRADTPIVNRFFDQYQKRGLKVLYVAMANETVDSVESFINDLEIVFPVALDYEGKMAADYEIRMVPQTIFLSPDQKIITAILGGVGEAEIQELVGKYLTE